MIGVGEPSLAQELLGHPVLRNTAHALYLAVPPRAASGLVNDSGDDDEAVAVISRCHYCDQGQSKNVILDTWHPLRGFQDYTDIFPGKILFHAIFMLIFPYILKLKLLEFQEGTLTGACLPDRSVRGLSGTHVPGSVDGLVSIPLVQPRHAAPRHHSHAAGLRRRAHVARHRPHLELHVSCCTGGALGRELAMLGGGHA